MDNGFGGKGYEIEKKRIRPLTAPVWYVAPRCENKNSLRATAEGPILYCAESRLKS